MKRAIQRYGFEAILAVAAGAVTTEAVLWLTRFLVGGTGGAYGAPLPIGESHESILFGGPATFSAAAFAVDLIITAAVFFALARQAGRFAVVLSLISALAFLTVLLYWTAVAVSHVAFPFYGFPIPLNPIVL